MSRPRSESVSESSFSELMKYNARLNRDIREWSNCELLMNSAYLRYNKVKRSGNLTQAWVNSMNRELRYLNRCCIKIIRTYPEWTFNLTTNYTYKDGFYIILDDDRSVCSKNPQN